MVSSMCRMPSSAVTSTGPSVSLLPFSASSCSFRCRQTASSWHGQHWKGSAWQQQLLQAV